MTFNFGESNRPQFAEFIEREKPDFILLQDARGLSAIDNGLWLLPIGLSIVLACDFAVAARSGGGTRRSWLPELSSQVRQLPACGSI